MHTFAPFSNLNFFVKNRQIVFAIELMNFINSTCGGFIQFVDLYDCLGIIQDGTHVKVKLIDNNTTDFNGWIHVERPQ